MRSKQCKYNYLWLQRNPEIKYTTQEWIDKVHDIWMKENPEESIREKVSMKDVIQSEFCQFIQGDPNNDSVTIDNSVNNIHATEIRNNEHLIMSLMEQFDLQFDIADNNSDDSGSECSEEMDV